MSAGWSCRHCNTRHKLSKSNSGHRKFKSFKRPRNLREKILAFISNKEQFGKEELSEALRVQEKYIEQELHKLNLEGKVSQPIHHAPHDSTRDKYGWGKDSSWCGDVYINLDIKKNK